MNIKTKYKIGQDVYVIFKENDGLIRITKAKVKEITIKEEKIDYYIDKIFEEFNENELIGYGEHDDLINKIEELLGDDNK